MEIKEKEWLTLKEAANHVGIPYARFTQIVKRGIVPTTKVPGYKRTYRISKTKLDQWMDENQYSPQGS